VTPPLNLEIQKAAAAAAAAAEEEEEEGEMYE
jgi:hypothetical protein